jgi:hypothetical protein
MLLARMDRLGQVPLVRTILGLAG